MKIILIQDVPNLGEEGDICEVANGYGRNYLLPKKFAVLFSKQNNAIIESRREAIEKRKEDKRVAAQGLKERLESEEISITMPAGESGKLFGSVTNATIAEYLEKKGIEVERKRIEVPSHNIKLTGNYEVKVKLYDQQTAIVKLEIKGENQGKEAAVAADEPKKKAEKEEKKAAEESSEAPAEEAPVEEAPAEEAPAEEAPAEEAEDQTEK